MLKAIAFAYWQVRRSFKRDRDEKWRASKALLVVCMAEFLVLWTLFAFAFVAIGTTPFPWSPTRIAIVLAPAAALLVAANRYLLRPRGKMHQWEREFEGYSRAKKTFGAVSVAIVLLLIFAATLWAKADWNRLYR